MWRLNAPFALVLAFLIEENAILDVFRIFRDILRKGFEIKLLATNNV